jgi:hypothetical protein
VATEPRVKFLNSRGLPRVGGYVAVAVPAAAPGAGAGAAPAADCYQAVLAADTLLPGGSGQGLPAGEVAVLWDVAQALGRALDAAEALRRCGVSA